MRLPLKTCLLLLALAHCTRSRNTNAPRRHYQSVSALQRLYAAYGEDLIHFRTGVRAWADEVGLHQGIGDIEAEILYMRLRDAGRMKPLVVYEMGFGQGLTTMVILKALKDNGGGELHTFDLKDSNNRHHQIKADNIKWILHLGDARQTIRDMVPTPDYIHSDAEHSTDFAHWLVDYLQSGPAILCSFHDVYTKDSSMSTHVDGSISAEGQVILRFLKSNARASDVFSVAKSHFGGVYRAVIDMRAGAGLDDDWISTKLAALNNPSVFFKLGAQTLTNV